MTVSHFNMDEISREYEDSRKKSRRELKKWAFAIGTFGLGALYLWATTFIVRPGEIGMRSNIRGKVTLIPPGRHSNFPWETSPSEPASLSTSLIKLGPFKIVRVETGCVAKTFGAKGQLIMLKQGQYLLSDPAHTVSSFISVKEETRKLESVQGYTSDNVGITLHADVRYQIEDPEAAIGKVDEIEKSILEIARYTISQIVNHHNLADFAPATNIGRDRAAHGVTSVITEITEAITQLLAARGIKLVTIGITSWNINDKSLAHELAQGAVIQSQAQSQMLSAQRAADVKVIAAEADAQAKIKIGEAEAKAIKLKGDAINSFTKECKENPAALAVYLGSQQVDLVRGANNPHLFFSQATTGGGAQLGLPQLTLPVVSPTAVINRGNRNSLVSS